jgi:hypothetical protein
MTGVPSKPRLAPSGLLPQLSGDQLSQQVQKITRRLLRAFSVGHEVGRVEIRKVLIRGLWRTLQSIRYRILALLSLAGTVRKDPITRYHAPSALSQSATVVSSNRSTTAPQGNHPHASHGVKWLVLLFLTLTRNSRPKSHRVRQWLEPQLLTAI